MSPDQFIPIPLDDVDGLQIVVDVPASHGQTLARIGVGDGRGYLSPDAARALASALEEAANYAEAAQDDAEQAAEAGRVDLVDVFGPGWPASWGSARRVY